MTYIKLLAIGLLLASVSCSAAQESDASGRDVASIIARHDEELRRELGIGLKEVGLIAQVAPKNFILEDAMGSAEREGYEVLVERGFLVSESVNATEGTFVSYQLTEKGKAIRDAIE